MRGLDPEKLRIAAMERMHQTFTTSEQMMQTSLNALNTERGTAQDQHKTGGKEMRERSKNDEYVSRG